EGGASRAGLPVAGGEDPDGVDLGVEVPLQLLVERLALLAEVDGHGLAPPLRAGAEPQRPERVAEELSEVEVHRSCLVARRDLRRAGDAPGGRPRGPSAGGAYPPRALPRNPSRVGAGLPSQPSRLERGYSLGGAICARGTRTYGMKT